MISEVPPLICNPELTEQIASFMKELTIPGMTPYPVYLPVLLKILQILLNAYHRHSCICLRDIWMNVGNILHIIRKYSLMKQCARSGRPVWLIVQRGIWLFNYYGMRKLRNKTTRSHPVHTDSWLESAQMTL